MTARQVEQILEHHGWMFDRKTASHRIYVKKGRRSIPVPIHGNRDLGTLANRILKQARIKKPRN